MQRMTPLMLLQCSQLARSSTAWQTLVGQSRITQFDTSPLVLSHTFQIQLEKLQRNNKDEQLGLLVSFTLTVDTAHYFNARKMFFFVPLLTYWCVCLAVWNPPRTHQPPTLQRTQSVGEWGGRNCSEYNHPIDCTVLPRETIEIQRCSTPTCLFVFFFCWNLKNRVMIFVMN